MKYALSAVLCSIATVSIGGASAALAASEPLDLRQTYSGFSSVDVSHIETLNTYANGLGTTNSFAISAGAFSFDDPFLKSSANPPIYTYFLGVSDSLPIANDIAFRSNIVQSQHLVLALNSAYAAGLVSGGEDFSQIFPDYDENSLINDLILIDSGATDPSDPGYAARQAAQQEVVNFGAEVQSRGGLTLAMGGPLTLLSFSSPTVVGSGTSDLIPVPTEGAVPEPATWGLMLLGFAAVGTAARRKPRIACTFA